MLLSFSTNSYASVCKNNYDILEIEYSALLKEYNGYRNQAISFVPNIKNMQQCFASYDRVERKKDNEITEQDCVELSSSISVLDNTMLYAAYKAYYACIYKNRHNKEACVNCDKIVVQETNYTARNSEHMKRLFDGKFASRMCYSDYAFTHPCDH